MIHFHLFMAVVLSLMLACLVVASPSVDSNVEAAAADPAHVDNNGPGRGGGSGGGWPGGPGGGGGGGPGGGPGGGGGGGWPGGPGGGGPGRGRSPSPDRRCRIDRQYCSHNWDACYYDYDDHCLTATTDETIFHLDDTVRLRAGGPTHFPGTSTVLTVGSVIRVHQNPADHEGDPHFDPDANLRPDTVQVLWLALPTLPPSTHRARDLVLVDRVFLPGDSVVSVADPTRQGCVTRVQQRVSLRDVRKTNSPIIANVPHAALKAAHPWLGPGTPVFDASRTSVGWVHCAPDFACRLRFASGAVADVDVEQLERFARVRYSDGRVDSPSAPMPMVEPGLVVVLPRDFPTSALKWISASHTMGMGLAVVVDLIPDQVHVTWAAAIAKAVSADSNVKNRVTMLHTDMPEHLPPAHIKVGEGLFVDSRTSFNLSSTVVLDPSHMDLWPEAIVDGNDRMFRIEASSTLLTVMWQDSSVTEGVTVHDVRLPLVMDDTRVWPGDIVWNRMGEIVNTDDIDSLTVGVAQSCDPVSKTAVVRWFNGDWTVLGEPETVSLYEVSVHPDFVLDLMSKVLLPSKVDIPTTSTAKPTPNDSPMWFGEVLATHLDGTRDVRVASGAIVSVKFDELLPVVGGGPDGQGDFGDDDDPHSDEGEASEWEDAGEALDDDEDEMEVDPVAAVLSSVAATVVENGAPDNHDDVDAMDDPPPSQRPPLVLSEAGGDESNEVDSTAAFEVLESSESFTFHFQDPSTLSASLMRALRKEHRLLSTSLPPGIVVRTYADRADIFSVLIYGPTDTPYARCPFTFEIQCPSDYPQSPPKAVFVNRSGGRVNPNLHEDGKVCLSLLGTWAGAGTESWSSTSSTLLQLVVSIQGLILVPRPFFLEPGFAKFEGTDDGERHDLGPEVAAGDVGAAAYGV
ncbi:hypothetical protein BC828DRAFT_438414 [Blastocladiella britannica]|nr:hypothetical protein BC828DRAFT_438414 [Blastocladiella britannica]